MVLLSRAHIGHGLVSAYYFSGNCRDAVSGFNGRAYGPSSSTDRFGNANAAYCFDGVDDYIKLGAHSDLKQQAMSISLWAKVHDFHNNRKNYPGASIINTKATDNLQYYEAYNIGIDSKGRKFTGSGSSSLQQQVGTLSTVLVEPQKWYHLVYMFDNDTAFLYVNGKLQQKCLKGYISSFLRSDSVQVGRVSNDQPQSPYYNYSFFKGCIDDIKIFGRLLTSDEIGELFSEPDPKVAGAPVPSKERDMVLSIAEKFWYIPLGILFFISLTIIIVRNRVRAVRRREREQSLLRQQLLQSEMKALRSQMNPHFIFNAINSIQHYVLTNEKDLANKYLVKFSKLMRNILDLSKEELITLHDELETVKLYLEIEALRFNNAFEFIIKCSDFVQKDQVRLPPLLIQPFVENAIWHGLLLKEGLKQLRIEISGVGNEILIKIDDNGIGRKSANKFKNREFSRKSLGMELTQSRLEVLQKVHGMRINFEVIDKVDSSGNAEGTTVVVRINNTKTL